MHEVGLLLKRELLAYFRTPLAYVFTVVFLLAGGACTFFIGGLYEREQANLSPFFDALPWLYLALIPAVAMRLWAEERQTGTIELLFTLPLTLSDAILGKFFAAWLFVGFGLLLTFPLPLTIVYLGDPDWGVLLASYLGAILTAGVFLSLSCLASALVKSQVSAFLLGLFLCFIMLLLGWGTFTDILSAAFPAKLVDTLATFGVMPHFQTMSQGVIDSRDLIYFLLMMGLNLVLTAEILAKKKAD